MAVDFSKMSPEELDALLASPAMVSPDGENTLIDPPNQTNMTIGLMGLCMGAVVFCLCIRGYARLILVKKIEAQEYMLVAAFLGFAGWCVCTMKIAGVMGYFVHQWDITFQQLVDAGMLIHISSNLYSAILPLLKISILVEWLGMFVPRGTRGWFFWACWFLIIVQVGFAIAAIVVLNVTCTPTNKKWEFYVAGECLDSNAIEVASASFQLASDFIILVLPQKLIWDLHMGWRKKLGVSIIFSLGAFACIAAGFRLANSVIYIEAEDLAYQVGPVALWAYAEMTCGFIVVCIPCVPRILMESGAWRKLKRTVGMNVTTGRTGASSTKGNSAVRSKNMRSQGDSYLELDDHELKSMGTESTEHLRDLKDRHQASGIVRTTQVSVTQGSESSRDGRGPQPHYSRDEQWGV